MDPPWTYYRSKSKTFKGAVPYATLNHEELAALPIKDIAKENCALLIWVTGPHLPSVFPLLEAWGFSYKTVFLVWRKVYKSGKPVCSIGWYTRPCHEYLLLAVRGSVLHLKQRSNLSQLLDQGEQVLTVDTVRGHSIKPDMVYAIVRQFFGYTTKNIELFARHPRRGWSTWGLEQRPFFVPAR